MSPVPFRSLQIATCSESYRSASDRERLRVRGLQARLEQPRGDDVAHEAVEHLRLHLEHARGEREAGALARARSRTDRPRRACRNSGLKRKLPGWKRPSVTSLSASRWRAGSIGVNEARVLPAWSRTYTTPPTYLAAICAASAYWRSPTRRCGTGLSRPSSGPSFFACQRSHSSRDSCHAPAREESGSAPRSRGVHLRIDPLGGRSRRRWRRRAAARSCARRSSRAPAFSSLGGERLVRVLDRPVVVGAERATSRIRPGFSLVERDVPGVVVHHRAAQAVLAREFRVGELLRRCRWWRRGSCGAAPACGRPRG